MSSVQRVRTIVLDPPRRSIDVFRAPLRRTMVRSARGDRMVDTSRRGLCTGQTSEGACANNGRGLSVQRAGYNARNYRVCFGQTPWMVVPNPCQTQGAGDPRSWGESREFASTGMLSTRARQLTPQAARGGHWGRSRPEAFSGRFIFRPAPHALVRLQGRCRPDGRP
jgi:hypothetical protein